MSHRLKPIDYGACKSCGRYVQNRSNGLCDSCKPAPRPHVSNTEAYWRANCPEMLKK